VSDGCAEEIANIEWVTKSDFLGSLGGLDEFAWIKERDCDLLFC
jgi:hypothetical protein